MLWVSLSPCLRLLPLRVGLTKFRFGAVMEEFEVRDALENIFSRKGDYAMVY